MLFFMKGNITLFQIVNYLTIDIGGYDLYKKAEKLCSIYLILLNYSKEENYV